MEYNMIFYKRVGMILLRGSTGYTAKQQYIQDIENETMQFGFEGDIVTKLISMITGYTVDEILREQNRMEAICYYRDYLGKPVLPPRTYMNHYNDYWLEFFGLLDTP